MSNVSSSAILSHELFDGWQHPMWAAIKAIALFVTAALAFRVAQRRTIAEFTPFDWVTAVAVGAIVGRVSTASDTSWLTGAAALLTLIGAHGVIARLRFVECLRRVIDPPLLVLIHDGTPNVGNLRRAGITHADLEGILRRHGHRSPAHVRLALYEAKGSVSIFTEDVPAVEPSTD